MLEQNLEVNKESADVQSVVFKNDANGYAVVRLVLKESGESIMAVGTLSSLVVGESVCVSGNWKSHPKYGKQIEVVSFTQERPATENGVVRFLASSSIKKIGPTLAERLVKHFGVEVLDILDTDPERLLEVKGISKKGLVDIISSWQEQREIKNLILFLHTHEVPATFAAKIFSQWGALAESRLRENPYELSYLIRGIGFKTADAMALKLGFEFDSLQRIEAAIEYVLTSQCEKAGHLFYPKNALLEASSKLLEGIDFEKLEQGIRALLERKRIVIEDLPEQEIEEAVYLRRNYRYEREITERLVALLTHPTPISEEIISTTLPVVESSLGFSLSEEQREAVVGACENKVFIITGGPGTGKTTITRAVVATLQKMNLKVKLVAPTGRAAKRLSEATGDYAMTVHRLLQFAPEANGFVHNEDNKLKTDVLVVDEASMLDAQLFLALLQALPITCRLILVGDVNQLPSVGAGNILSDCLESGIVPTVRLTHIFRQAQESFIVVNAHRINNGQFPCESPYPAPKADFFWIAQDDPKRVQALIVETVCNRIPERYGLNALKEVQVLTPMHKGEVGTITLNKILQERLNPSKGPKFEMQRGFTLFRLNDRVLQLRNNYDKDVFNGDLGFVVEIDKDADKLMVEFDDGRIVSFEGSDLDDMTLAYAISIHKSQGSEYPAVVIPIMTQHYMLLQRNLLYTGLTRAKRLAIMVGSERAFHIGLNNITAGKRFTHLRHRLYNALHN